MTAPKPFTLSEHEIARLWTFVDAQGADECWPWMGYRDKDGYGVFSATTKRIFRATRSVWFAHHGEQPQGIVCHSCDNPPCVNPAHLWTGSSAENARDMIEKGRHPKLGQDACFRGHPYDDDNTYTYRGYRACRACRRIAEQKRKAA